MRQALKKRRTRVYTTALQLQFFFVFPNAPACTFDWPGKPNMGGRGDEKGNDRLCLQAASGDAAAFHFVEK